VATRQMHSQVSTRRMQVLESKNEVAKETNLVSRCSVSALVPALVALFGRDPVVTNQNPKSELTTSPWYCLLCLA
jgi:hypothetical protein